MAYDCENDPGWQYLRLSRDQITKDQSTPYDSKKNCWIPDKDEGYIAAEIQSTKGDMTTVLATGKEVTLKKDLVSEMNPPKFEKTEDMSNLTFLNDASVLHNLRARYKSMLIYTYSGLFCVVINPYKRLPIYTDSVARMYMGKRRNEMPPHLFAVSDEAYRRMLQDHENQSMLITGESGAGKTENTKKVIAYFASVGASQAETKPGAEAKDGKKKVTLEDQIVQTNPILEAFGNARTVRNNNSSRFGKFIRIHFSKLGKVASCDIEHYLLEKSRVIRQAPGERCYHIFYQIFSDYKPELKKILLLDRPLRDYWFVAQAELIVDGMNDAEEFQLTDEAFEILHFTEEERLDCYKLMSAHMHLGNMKFKQRPREEQAEPDGTEEAEKAANMYGVDTDILMKCFTHPRVKVGTEWVNKGQNVEQVNWAVGAVGKAIYARVFHWLVKKCNLTLDQKGTPRNYFIGVLDIAGFEIFDFNSFEQLWINFVNEKLQQFFNHHMFILEQEEYKREGIQWTFIDFGLDLQACIELIEKPLGIISMLDEECIVPKASDMTLAQKLNEQHLGKHPNFEKPKPPKGKQAEAHFAMRHYAGVVRYNVMNWLEKNKDPLNDSVAACLKASKENHLLNEIWSDYVTQEEASQAMKSGGGGGGKKKGKSGSFMTVSMLYRESLNNLMTMLYKTHPHFIRCIIPNEKKTCGLLDASLVLNQLTCNGVLEGIRICRKGFPNRMLHPDFVQRYAILCAVESKSNPDPKECGVKMMARLVSEGKITEEMYRTGLTKVFFKAGVLAHMEDLRDERLGYIISGLQAVIRYNFAIIDLKRRKEQVEGMRIIQENIRQWTFSLTWPWFKLYVDVMPIVRESKIGEVIEQLKLDLEAEKEKLVTKSKERVDLEKKAKIANTEMEELRKQITSCASEFMKIEEEMTSLESMNHELEQQLMMIEAKVVEENGKIEERLEQKKSLEHELDELRRGTHKIETDVRKTEAEKKSMDDCIQKLRKEIMQHDELLTKTNKEQGKLEETGKEINEKIDRESARGLQASRVSLKLKEQLENSQSQLQTERQNKSETEKAKRKVEGEMRIAHETLGELRNQKHEAENILKKKEKEYFVLRIQAENEEITECKVLRQLKEDDKRIHELEEATEAERSARLKIEQYRLEKQREVDELNEKLLEQMEVNSGYTEASKKQDAELLRLRNELEEARSQSALTTENTRKKFIESIDELNEQMELFRRRKQRSDQECLELQLQVDKVTQLIKTEDDKKTVIDGSIVEMRTTISDMELKCEQFTNEIREINDINNRISVENDAFSAEVNGYKAEINKNQKEKTELGKKIEELEFTLHEVTNAKQQLNAKVKNLHEELDRVDESLLDEGDQKETTLRQIAKLDQEMRQMISKQEDGNRIAIQIFEDEKLKRNATCSKLEEKLGASELELKNLEIFKSNLSKEAEDIHLKIEQSLINVAHLEKALLNLEKLQDEHLLRIDSVKNIIMSLKNDFHTTKHNQNNENSILDALKLEAAKLRDDEKILKEELSGLHEELRKGNERLDSLEKLRHRYEVEKQELLHESDENEARLEVERTKNSRCTREILDFIAGAEKRIREKEEELENVKRSSQRTLDNKMVIIKNAFLDFINLHPNMHRISTEDTLLDGMQLTKEENDSEKREKLEIEKICKKLRNDVNEFRLSMDHAKKANNDSQNNIKRYKDQIHEVRLLIDAGLRNQGVLQQQKQKADSDLLTEELNNGGVVAKLTQVRRESSHLSTEIDDLRNQVNEASRQISENTSKKKRLDRELSDLKQEVDDINKQMKLLNEKSTLATVDTARLQSQLNADVENNDSLEREKGKLSLLLKDLQTKIDNVEVVESKKAGKTVQQLKERLKGLESEIEGTRIRQNEAAKNSLNKDRKIYQLEYELTEISKNFLHDNELVEKLKNRVRKEQKKLDEMEEFANSALQKYMGLQKVFDFTMEHADEAEMKFRISRVAGKPENYPN